LGPVDCVPDLGLLFQVGRVTKMIWLILGFYWTIGLIIAHRGGWVNGDIWINIKLAVLCGLGWPYVIISDWLEGRGGLDRDVHLD